MSQSATPYHRPPPLSHQRTFTDNALTLAYKVQRKLRRYLRKRFAAALVRGDLKSMRRQLRGNDARGILLGYAEPASTHWPTAIGEVLCADEQAAILTAASNAATHHFDILGSGRVHAGAPIDWHRDLKTGHRWPADLHHLDIAWNAVPAGSDIKMPWELSRCHHLVTLALADRVDGDSRHYEEFKSQIRDWIRSNPCGFGVNWVCAMDVAIRAVNWLSAAALFRERLISDNDESFANQLIESLWCHGRHIMRNLEWQGPRSATLANHFLANLCGLLAVGALFQQTPQGRRWLAFSHKWLENEIRRQVLDDGVNFETSTNYHRLTFEMFSWSASVARAIGRPFSEHYHDKIEAMARFSAACMSPSGRAAQFGDNDSGRLLTPGIGEPADHRYLAGGPCGPGGRASRLLLGLSPDPSAASHDGKFPVAGFYFGAACGAWLGVRAGRLFHTAGHGHADQLDFVLAVAGRDFIIDPGTGVYSADVAKRNHYRGAAAHNGPRLNQWEPNVFPLDKSGIFRFSDNTRAETIEWVADAKRIHFSGRHHGYERLRAGCQVTREILLENGHLQVCDGIRAVTAGDRVDWTFRFAPGIDLAIDADGASASAGDIRVRVSFDPPVSLHSEAAAFSPGYGVEQPAMALHASRMLDATGDATQRIHFHWEEPNTN